MPQGVVVVSVCACGDGRFQLENVAVEPYRVTDDPVPTVVDDDDQPQWGQAAVRVTACTNE